LSYYLQGRIQSPVQQQAAMAAGGSPRRDVDSIGIR